MAPTGFFGPIGDRPTECVPAAFSEVIATSFNFSHPNGAQGFRAPLPSTFQALVPTFSDLGVLSVTGTSQTLIPYLAPSGGVSPAVFPFYMPANSTSVLVCPAGDACVGSIELSFFASFGSVRGRVIQSDGSPVGAGFSVAAYRLDQPGSPQRAVLTDANGAFTFNMTEANLLLNETRSLGSLTVLAGVSIRGANNWGLPVDPDAAGPGRRPYALVAGSGVPGFNTPGQRIAKVQSSQAEAMTLIVDLPTDGCPIAPLSPITDPDALDFEANDKVFRTHDRNGVNRMAAGMLPLTGVPLQGRIACLQDAIGRLGGRWMPESAWRPDAYQAHLYEIFLKRRELRKYVNDSRCDAVRAQVEAENNRHGLGKVVGQRSAHTEGKAIDIATDRPRPCDDCFILQGPPDMPGEVIDSLASRCGLSRLAEGKTRRQDPGHFSTTGR